MRDVLIAGGGIAGSSLAILLGRQGLSVELFERVRFPREKPCGEGLMPAGVAVLERMGLAKAVGGEVFRGVRYHFDGQTAEGRFPKVAGMPDYGWGQRRRVLDEVLFKAAAATPGVLAFTGMQVDGALMEKGHVAGLVVGGEPRRGALVVAADGVHSRLRRLLGLDAPVRRKRSGIRAHFRLAPSQSPSPWVDVFLGRGHELYVTPLPDGEILVAALADAGELEGPADLAFHRWCRAEPALAARLEGAEQVSALRGMSPLASRARAGVAPGIVLLGDAAGFLDPITGGGMAQALLSAELLAGYVAREGTCSDAWLWRFERERRAMLRDYSILTGLVLWLAGHTWLARRALSLLGASPALFSHLIGVSGGVRRLFGGIIQPERPCAASGRRPIEPLSASRRERTDEMAVEQAASVRVIADDARGGAGRGVVQD